MIAEFAGGEYDGWTCEVTDQCHDLMLPSAETEMRRVDLPGFAQDGEIRSCPKAVRYTRSKVTSKAGNPVFVPAREGAA